MEMDDAELHFRTGDCFIQRGTIHNWVNRGSEPCRIAFVLVAAESAKAGGKVLEAVG